MLSAQLSHESLQFSLQVIVQGAWLASAHSANVSSSHGAATLAEFKKFKLQMEALLNYWEQPPRKDTKTGLYVWHDQLQVRITLLI